MHTTPPERYDLLIELRSGNCRLPHREIPRTLLAAAAATLRAWDATESRAILLADEELVLADLAVADVLYSEPAARLEKGHAGKGENDKFSIRSATQFGREALILHGYFPLRSLTVSPNLPAVNLSLFLTCEKIPDSTISQNNYA